MAKERSEEEQIDTGDQAAENAVEVENPSAEEQHAAEEALAEENAQDEEIASLHQQLSDHKDMVLRAQAEVQNARRRAQQDVEKAHKFGQEKLLKDLLPVVDNLERALATIDKDDEAQKAVREGIELTQKSFIDTLTKSGMELIDPAGEPFDPELHQAMTQIPNGDVEPNTVLDVFQKGYRLNGRLLRPAMVVVSKAP
ncbi:nucleotide exchange factor GrpE [Microbulbifer agarilyticus]|uniref:nucleotide exchange factor GrpE n=1 Tax=Microbulbifer agarilyticus TaxID=260552 RepID=UPI001C966AE4|nr:nucleotide exchange factor GrpE [Microbulbifer agarilyticus]MBY6210373.1 nucleotide exchange factor GrpE [Microbulbifer agarilyticus]MCA0892862.1 nucleotide exchange factor GrpE [Microbulbifer agarilyticus]